MADVNLDGGAVDMHTEQTDVQLSLLQLAGRQLDDAWTYQQSLIGNLEKQIGNGPLGRAFAAQYNAAVEPLVDAVGLAFGAPELMALSGRGCVLAYLLADFESRRAVEGASEA